MANIERPKTPLDETLWRDQAWYRMWGPLTAFTVMDYFRLSTFFDNTSNNGTLFQQMQFRPEIRAELSTPDLFNARLRRMTGVEYMLVDGSPDTGVWVIRKQLRRGMRVDDNTGAEVEDVAVLATYYVVGENVFVAPPVGAVLGGRMMTAITALRKAQAIAAGISAYPPTTTTAATATATATGAAAGSGAGTATAAAPVVGKDASAKDLLRTLTMQRRYKDEYMDDHAPLLGDPGSFLQAAPTAAAAGGSRSGTPAVGGAGKEVAGGAAGAGAGAGAGVGTPRRK